MPAHVRASPGLLVQESVGFLRDPLAQTSGGRGPSGRSPLGGRGHSVSKGAQAGGLEHLWGEDDGGRRHGDEDGDVAGHCGLGWCRRRGDSRRRGLGHRGHHIDRTLWFGGDERRRYFNGG